MFYYHAAFTLYAAAMPPTYAMPRRLLRLIRLMPDIALMSSLTPSPRRFSLAAA